MSGIDKIINDNFFLIDSNNLTSVKEKFYGYAIGEHGIIQDGNIEYNTNLGKCGAYVHVKVTDKYININQDFIGSYGLYLYKYEDFFAISNSFLKLVEYLKYNHPISFNKDFADAFLFAPLSSFVLNETLINEIEMLPDNCDIIIDKKDKSITYNKIDYQEYTLYLDSKEGMDVLDKWYDKWINILRFIRSKTNDIVFELSGGLDTRIIAALWLSANINLNKIEIRSYLRSPEDLRIASLIANNFKFNLNNQFPIYKQYLYDTKDTLDISFYPKLGFNKEMYYQGNIFLNPLYVFTGMGDLRRYPNQNIKEYIEGIVSPLRKYGDILLKPSLNLLNKGLDALSDEPYIQNEYDLTAAMYKKARYRHHFGKASVENYLINRISLSPIIDPELNKLNVITNECDDELLLMIMILVRFCPSLLNYEIEGNRKFNQETVEYAKKINNKFPLVKKDYDFVEGPDVEERNNVTGPKSEFKNPDEYMKKIFSLDAFEKEFEKYYSKEIYEDIKRSVKNKTKFPVSNIHSAITIIKYMNDVKFSEYKNYSSYFDWLKSYDINYYGDYGMETDLNSINSLYKYITARIDIKNHGTDKNKIKIVKNSDSYSMVQTPMWFEDEFGQGTVIQSKKGNLNITIECINQGNLKIWLRGIDFRNGNKRIPIYVKYLNLTINNEKIIEKPIIACHDEPFVYEMSVGDLKKVDISIIWETL